MSKYQALIDALKAGPVEYACHCDLEPHMKPDGCVLDEGKPENCIYAERLVKRGLSKTDCAEWKPISVVKPTIDVKAEDLRALLADLEMAEKALKKVDDDLALEGFCKDGPYRAQVRATLAQMAGG